MTYGGKNKMDTQFELTKDEIKNIWQTILYRMRERYISPIKLANQTGQSRDFIERGIKGEPERLELRFLQNCVRTLIYNPISGRTNEYDKVITSLSFQDCVRLLKPSPQMPPRSGNPWEWDD
jgi:hypothetical protein